MFCKETFRLQLEHCVLPRIAALADAEETAEMDQFGLEAARLSFARRDARDSIKSTLRAISYSDLDLEEREGDPSPKEREELRALLEKGLHAFADTDNPVNTHMLSELHQDLQLCAVACFDEENNY